MQLVLYATQVIHGKTYATSKSTLSAKKCRAPDDAESFIIALVSAANISFDLVRRKMKSDAKSE